MPTHADAYSDGQLSEYSYTESYDTIDELLKRFTLDYTPEYSIKLREKCVLMAASDRSSRAERLDNFDRFPSLTYSHFSLRLMQERISYSRSRCKL